MRPRYLIVPLLCASFFTACLPLASLPEVPPPRPPTPTITPRPTPVSTPTPALEITAENVYEDAVGSLRLLLEVRNANDYPVEGVRTTVVLRDEGGKVVSSESAYAKLDLLEPNDIASVLVVFFLANPPYATHHIHIDAKRADYLQDLLHPALEVVAVSGRIGEWVPYEVVGQVHNAGHKDAEAVTLFVTCHDAQERLVAIGTGRPASRAIPAGGTSEFLISVGAVAGGIESCRVQVEGLLSDPH
jgi:hypothetical protein